MLSDSRPVEERTHEWWESMRAKRQSTAEALMTAEMTAAPRAASPTAAPSSGTYM